MLRTSVSVVGWTCSAGYSDALASAFDDVDFVDVELDRAVLILHG